MTTDADKIRFLAELAGWEQDPDQPGVLWKPTGYGGLKYIYRPDYPHSLDAITRDLLPILQEKGMGWQTNAYRNGMVQFDVLDAEDCILTSANSVAEPARAAFEAIWQALGDKEDNHDDRR